MRGKSKSVELDEGHGFIATEDSGQVDYCRFKGMRKRRSVFPPTASQRAAGVPVGTR